MSRTVSPRSIRASATRRSAQRSSSSGQPQRRCCAATEAHREHRDRHGPSPSTSRRPHKRVSGRLRTGRRSPVGLRTVLRRLMLPRSEEHTSELQSLMRISYAVFCLKKKKQKTTPKNTHYANDILTKNIVKNQDLINEKHD